MSTRVDAVELTMDPTSLYREEIFTDRKMGTIRVLTPVTQEGSMDPSREILYLGEAQLLTPGGVLPLGFDIEAGSLREAVQKFADAAKDALERTVREIQELRREAASSIVVPSVVPDLRGGPVDPRGRGGLPGGGLIRP